MRWILQFSILTSNQVGQFWCRAVIVIGSQWLSGFSPMALTLTFKCRPLGGLQCIVLPRQPMWRFLNYCWRREEAKLWRQSIKAWEIICSWKTAPPTQIFYHSWINIQERPSLSLDSLYILTSWFDVSDSTLNLLRFLIADMTIKIYSSFVSFVRCVHPFYWVQ